MIKVLTQDTIIDIISKMKWEEGKEIVIEFPFWHPILHNYLSLKILKNKAGHKDVIIVTSDLTSRKIWKQLGIKYSIIKDPKFHEEKHTQKALLSYNFTFFEYASFELKKYWREFKETFRENKNVKYYSNQYEQQKSRIGFFVFWLFVSILLIIFIFYFAVTKTYVSIAPEVEIKTRGKNITFKEVSNEFLVNDNNVVAMRKISKTINLSSAFWATGIDIKNVGRSKGTVMIYNLFEEDAQLKQNSRLQTESGAIFLISQRVTVPKAVKLPNGTLKPGTMEVEVQSDIKDINGKMIGAEGNIGTGQTLLFPWLNQDKDKMYAKATSQFVGGKSYDGKHIITQWDIDNAKNLLTQKMKDKALSELKNQIREENKLNNVTYEIVWVDNSLFYSDENITVPSDVTVWKIVENFQLSGSVKLDWYIYNRDSVINKLRNVVSESIIEWSEKILLVDDKTLRFATVVFRQDQPFEFKATMEIDAFIVHDFLNTDDSYVQRLKNMIAGMPEEEARKALLNDPKISNVSIEITPFFVNNVTSRLENIIFKVSDKMN